MIAALSGLAAAWIAAGSAGLMAHPLRGGLTWAFLGLTVLAAWPGWGRCAVRIPLLLLAVAALLLMRAPLVPMMQVLAVAVVLTLLAIGRDERGQRVLVGIATAVFTLAVYRFALYAIAPFWLWMNAVGQWLGTWGTRISGEPLQVGATYAGLDYLVTMLALCIVWIAAWPRGRTGRAIVGVALIVVAHGLYLYALACSPMVLEWLGEPAEPELSFGMMPPWSWPQAVRETIPWSVPALAGLIHLVPAMMMLISMTCARPGTAVDATANTAGTKGHAPVSRGPAVLALIVAVLFAGLLPIATTLTRGKGTLEGTKVVAYEKGFLNWLKPEHGEYGRLSVGMYGMLPEYVDSLGGECVISPNLSQEDLTDADLLILFYPEDPWEPGQLERIHAFVREGGSLLVMGEHTVMEQDGGARFNDVLEPTAMRVRFDSASFRVGGWLHSYEARAHPTTAMLDDDRNQFGCVIGASVETHWPAQPLLIGRWGWNDPGNPDAGPSMMGNHAYDPGEKLGNIILASEQRLGKGKIVAFGDTSAMTNGITPGAYVFTSRLMAYLADDAVQSPQSPWRGMIGLSLAVVLILAMLCHPDRARLIVVPIVMAGSLAFSLETNKNSCFVLPDGRGHTPNNIAYIGASHLEAKSDESWRTDGVGGLTLTLMRNGYRVFNLPEMTADRLERAGLLVCIGSTRRFTVSERRAIDAFLHRGGTLIATAGLEEPRCEGLLDLMAYYGLYVGEAFPDAQGNIPEPEPLGHFKSPYFNGGDYMAYVRFHAAWPVLSTEPDTRAIAYGRGERNVILVRTVGEGKIVFIGDTCFAMNKNLERRSGQPFEGQRENADFWRWLITFVNDQPWWKPPDPNRAAKPPSPTLQPNPANNPATEPATLPTDTPPADEGGAS